MKYKHKMTTEREGAILEKAVEVFGGGVQEDKLIEEMSELTKAILKLRHAALGKKSEDVLERLEDNVCEEMADVQIMLNQMVLIHGDFNELEIAKLERLEARLHNS